MMLSYTDRFVARAQTQEFSSPAGPRLDYS